MSDTLANLEQMSWTQHKIIKGNNESHFAQVDADDEIQLCYYEDSMYGLKYQHYFLIFYPSKCIAEFHGIDHFIALFQIHNKAIMREYIIETKPQTKFTEEMKVRLQKVENMSNYSLLLRNCEHVAKYVIYGKWFSKQTIQDGNTCFRHFYNVATDHAKHLINILPDNLEEVPIQSVMYEIGDKWKFKCSVKSSENFYHERADSFNVLLIGPTGSGKSNLINHIYKSDVAPSEKGASGVTKSICFYPGTYEGPTKQGNICLIDTVGFCDEKMPLKDIIGMIVNILKNQELPIHRVLIVFGERVRDAEKEALEEYKKHLKFEKFKKNFSLILTKCDDIIGDLVAEEKYMVTFHNLDCFNLFKGNITGKSLLNGKKVVVPKTICTGLKDIRRTKPNTYDSSQREKVIGIMMYYFSNPIVVGSKECPCTLL